VEQHLVAPPLTSVAFGTCDVTGIAVLSVSIFFSSLSIFFVWVFFLTVTFLADIWHAPCGPAFLVWRSAFDVGQQPPKNSELSFCYNINFRLWHVYNICVWVWLYLCASWGGGGWSEGRGQRCSCPFSALQDSLEIAPINAKHNNSIYHAQLKWFVANANDAPAPPPKAPSPPTTP